ncbi:MAG TPA: YceI family protein [Mycobacteriales bacterium]|jgi:polyisoprenoid-binding protein YceI|nr:YceI family protein [Mycobacteriales bacterium]
MRGPRHWGWKHWTITGVVLAVVVFVGGPFLYIHVIEGPAPKKLSVANTGDTSAPTVPVAGTWKVTTGSQVGYRVKEVLFGQSTTAVGRTDQVSGTMTVTSTAVTAASFVAQMSSVHSDQGNRDGQFRGRIMDVATYPTATFALRKPVPLGPLPSGSSTRTYQVEGTLTMHGVARQIVFPLTAKRSGTSIALSGQLPITFADYGIPNPTFGPARVGDSGTLEVLLTFVRA